jgi:GT2 family glycosyltransferase
VVAPTYNRPEALARLLGALALQQGATVEVVVVDDGGAADLEPVVAPWRARMNLRLLRQENAGPAAARNRGAAQAAAPVLAFTDDDCAPRPGWAATMRDAVQGAARGSERGASAPTLVGGLTVNAVSGNLFAEASQDVVDALSAPGAPDGAFAASNNIAMPRAAFLELGGFDAAYPLAAGEDRAFCRAWSARGWPVIRAEAAVVDHHHDLTLRGFWRQHRNYGRGARIFHAGSADARHGGGAQGRLGFYARLVTHPLRAAPGLRGAARAGLVAVAQAATAVGYFASSPSR